MGLFDCYFRFLSSPARYGVVLFWLGALIAAIFIGPKFLGNTHNTFKAPSGTAAYEAEAAYELNYPEDQGVGSMVVLIHSTTKDSVISPITENIHNQLSAQLDQYEKDHPGMYKGIQGYYTFANTTIFMLCQQFINPAQTSTIISISYNDDSNHEVDALIRFVRDFTHSVETEGKVSVGLTGNDVLSYDIGQGSEKDMLKIDSIVLPLAFFVLSLYLKSLRLLLIPLFTVPTSIFVAFMIMYPVSNSLPVVSFAPSIMMSLTIAMSIDYSLFLLTRYREEVLSHPEQSNTQCVKQMLYHAGEVVGVSGATLAICFMGLVLFPLDFLRTIGISAATSICTTLLINLSVVPCLLMIFGNFFRNFYVPKIVRRCAPKFWLEDIPVETTMDMDLLLADKPVNADTPSTPVKRSFWYRAAVFATTSKYAVAIILVVIACIAPIAYHATKMGYTIDTAQLTPRNSESLAVFNEVKEDFNAGIVSHYRIIVVGNDQYPVLTSEFYQTTNDLVEDLLSNNLAPASGLSALTFFNNETVTVQEASDWLNGSPDPRAIYYQLLWGVRVNANKTAAMIDIQTDFDPLGDHATDWIKEVRKILDAEQFVINEQKLPFRLYLSGGAVENVDAVAAIFSKFGFMVGITMAVVFVIVTVVFRSAFLPLRLMLTVSLPIVFTYGMAVMIYQLNYFDWLNSQLSNIHNLYWLTPVMSFSILVGLALDYDCFLYFRIVEYRQMGYTTRGSIIKGIEKTAGVITGAGVIMAIAFAGLLLSSETVLNEFGFMLSFAVLVDTFIIAVLVVPAILHLAGEVNWWPSKKPTPNKDELTEDGEDTDVVVHQAI